MSENDRPAACPECTEPAEDGDLFCGACGTDLRPRLSTAPGGDFDPRTPRGGTHVTVRQPPPGASGTGSRAGHGPSWPGETTGRGDAPAPPAPAAEAARQDAGARPAPAPAPASPQHAPAADAETRDDSPEREKPEQDTPGCVACGTGSVGPDGHCTHCGHEQPVARDHWEREVAGIAAASDRGLRHRRNEDFFAVSAVTTPSGGPSQIAVVCDGVSSASRSDQASEAAAEAAAASMRESIPRGAHPQHAMHDALLAAAEAVDVLATPEEREAQQNAPACTIVGAVTADGVLTVGWVGDSRAYWVPDDRTQPPSRLTQDDSWAAQMIGAGLMTEAQAYADARAHAITGWLGADAYELDPHTASFKPDRSGVVVVCSDGLWNYADASKDMAAALPADAATRPMAAVRHLVGFALDGGGHDNVTVALVPVAVPADSPAASPAGA